MPSFIRNVTELVDVADNHVVGYKITETDVATKQERIRWEITHGTMKGLAYVRPLSRIVSKL